MLLYCFLIYIHIQRDIESVANMIIMCDQFLNSGYVGIHLWLLAGVEGQPVTS